MPISETRLNLNSDDDMEEVTINGQLILKTDDCISFDLKSDSKEGKVIGFPGRGKQPDGILVQLPSTALILLCENTENKCSERHNAIPVQCDYSTIKKIDCQTGGSRTRTRTRSRSRSRSRRQQRRRRQSRQSRQSRRSKQ
jgi:hypothetical protein